MTSKQTKDTQLAQRIVIDDSQSVRDWADRFDVSPDQIKNAVDRVGPMATDVEMHLIGSRSITNEQRVESVGDLVVSDPA